MDFSGKIESLRKFIHRSTKSKVSIDPTRRLLRTSSGTSKKGLKKSKNLTMVPKYGAHQRNI